MSDSNEHWLDDRCRRLEHMAKEERWEISEKSVLLLILKELREMNQALYEIEWNTKDRSTL